MNRIAIRLGLLLFYGVVAGGVASGCATEDGTFRPLPDSGVKNAGGSAGVGGQPGKPPCKPEYCPAHPPAQQCCVTMYDCGLDYGTGCLAAAKKDGGQ